jgi:hypothetical protein
MLWSLASTRVSYTRKLELGTDYQAAWRNPELQLPTLRAMEC